MAFDIIFDDFIAKETLLPNVTARQTPNELLSELANLSLIDWNQRGIRVYFQCIVLFKKSKYYNVRLLKAKRQPKADNNNEQGRKCRHCTFSLRDALSRVCANVCCTGLRERKS